MYSMKELIEVQETKHLVPNLAVLAKAVFGDNAYLTSKVPHQADWATSKFKIGDGLLWLPWSRQLWLIEVEWKEGSNFFDQSRAFAEGEVDVGRLCLHLEDILDQFKEVLNRSSSALREGIITENIIKETFNNHIFKGRLCPHGWVILGHSGNREKLRQDYEKELKSRFGGDKHYILSMARMFQGDFSSYILLEQYCSKGCQELLNVERSILVPASISSISEVIINSTEEPEEVQEVTSQAIPDQVESTGRIAQFWSYLIGLRPSLSPESVRLRIQIDEHHYHDFKPLWTHRGREFMVFSKLDIPRKPSNAAKEVFGDLAPKQYSNIARKAGAFLDISETPPRKIADYKDVEHYIWKYGHEPHISSLNKKQITKSKKEENYFYSRDAHKQRKIIDNVLNRKKLWEVFLEKKRMTSAEFKELSEFKPKAIAGFMQFLTRNGIAERYGDTFKLVEDVIPPIKRLLEKGVY